MRGKFDAFGRNFFALKKSKMQDQGLFAYMQEDICRIVKSEKVADFRFHIMVGFFSMNLTVLLRLWVLRQWLLIFHFWHFLISFLRLITLSEEKIVLIEYIFHSESAFKVTNMFWFFQLHLPVEKNNKYLNFDIRHVQIDDLPTVGTK